MAIAFVQAKSIGTSASATTLPLTVTALGSGNLVAGIVTWGSGTTGDLTSVTDGTNTYTIVRRIADTTNGQSAASFYAKNVSGAPTTITANFGSSLGYRGMSICEFSGVETTSPLDGTNEQGQWQTSPGTGTDGAKSGSGTQTPSQDNCVVFGGSVKTGATADGSSHFTAGTSFTEPANAEHFGNTDIDVSSEYWLQTSATAANASFTVRVNTHHITMQMVFIPPAAGSVTGLMSIPRRGYRPRGFAPGLGR